MPKIVIESKPPFARIRTAAFWDRFTAGELVDYDVAMQHDPAATNNAKKAAAKLRVFMRRADLRGFVKLSSQNVTNTFADLVTAGILTQARSTAILTTAITSDEAYVLPGEMS